jgi:hypothetical protein
MTINLPFNLNPSMDLDDALMAIQRNFDHLSGKLGGVNQAIEIVSGSVESNSDAIDEAIGNVEIDWGMFSDGVGSIRFAADEAQLATWEDNGEVHDGDCAFIEGQVGLYKYLTTQPTATTYDATGTPQNTLIPPVTGTDSWYRTADAADFLANSITATHLQVETLDAISANLGTVTAGSIFGITITGGIIRTAVSGERIEILSGEPDRISFYMEGGADFGNIRMLPAGSPGFTSGRLKISAGNGIQIDSGLWLGTNPADVHNALHIRNVTSNAQILIPPAGYVAIFYNSASGTVVAKDSSGTNRALQTSPF